MNELTIENLKCCGNCQFRMSEDFGESYHEDCLAVITENKPAESYRYCDNWKYDNMDRHSRKL